MMAEALVGYGLKPQATLILWVGRPLNYEDGQWTAYQINSTPYVGHNPTTSEPSSSSNDNIDTLGIIVFAVLAIIVGAIRLRRRSYY